MTLDVLAASTAHALIEPLSRSSGLLDILLVLFFGRHLPIS